MIAGEIHLKLEVKKDNKMKRKTQSFPKLSYLATEVCLETNEATQIIWLRNNIDSPVRTYIFYETSRENEFFPPANIYSNFEFQSH